VPAAQRRVGHVRGLGERELHPRGDDPLPPDDHREVVQGRAREEDGLEQLGRDDRVERRAALDQPAQTDAPLQHDDRPEPLAPEVDAGRDDVLDHPAQLGGLARAHELGLAQAAERPAELGGEHDDHHDREQGEHSVEQEREPLERVARAHQADDERADDEHEQQALEHPRRAGALDEPDEREDHDPDQDELETDLPEGIGAQSLDQVSESVQDHRRGLTVGMVESRALLIGTPSVRIRPTPQTSPRDWASAAESLPPCDSCASKQRRTPTRSSASSRPGTPRARCARISAPSRRTRRGDGLARSLFEIPGVTNVLIHTAFVTVGKAPEAKWPAIKKRVRAAIESSDAEADDPGAGADV
jgi:hypothetical protein